MLNLYFKTYNAVCTVCCVCSQELVESITISLFVLYIWFWVNVTINWRNISVTGPRLPIIPNIEALKPPEPLDHKESSFPEEPGTPELDESSDKNYTMDVSDSTHLLFLSLLYITVCMLLGGLSIIKRNYLVSQSSWW